MTRQQWIDQFAAELSKWLGGDTAELQAIAEPRAADGMRSSLTPAQQATSYKLRREQWVAEVIAGGKLPRLRASPAALAFREEWTREVALRLACPDSGEASPGGAAIAGPKALADRLFASSGATLMPGKAVEAFKANGLPEDDE